MSKYMSKYGYIIALYVLVACASALVVYMN